MESDNGKMKRMGMLRFLPFNTVYSYLDEGEHTAAEGVRPGQGGCFGLRASRRKANRVERKINVSRLRKWWSLNFERFVGKFSGGQEDGLFNIVVLKSGEDLGLSEDSL